MIVEDVANFVLGGIPGDLHDMFVTDVEPADLAQASALFQAMSDSVGAIHVTLSGSVASLEGRWQGDGAAAFDSEIWQPLSHGLGVLERECGTASSELARLAVQAEQAQLYKVEELNQEIQNQLWIFAGTSLIGGPELGGVISDAVGGLAARLGGQLAGRMVTGIVDAISTLLRKVLDAFSSLFRWVSRPVTLANAELRSKLDGIVGMITRTRLAAPATPIASGQIVIGDDVGPHIFRDAPGHLSLDTTENRALVTETANNPANLLGTDQWGSDWYARTLPDGSQVWVRVQDGVIRSAGINATPGTWNPGRGLRR